MKLATILAFDRQLLDESTDEKTEVLESTTRLDDVLEFEEDMVEAA